MERLELLGRKVRRSKIELDLVAFAILQSHTSFSRIPLQIGSGGFFCAPLLLSSVSRSFSCFSSHAVNVRTPLDLCLSCLPSFSILVNHMHISWNLHIIATKGNFLPSERLGRDSSRPPRFLAISCIFFFLNLFPSSPSS